MKTKNLWLLVFVVIIVTAVIFYPQQKEPDAARVRIGAPDDMGGLIINYIIKQKGFKSAKLEQDFSMYSIKDCCASTAEWAMSTDMLDIALMCPDAAQRLVEKDQDFEVLGPCLVNSDVIVVKPGKHQRKIAVSQKREYQRRLVRDKFGENCAAVSMMTAAIPFAYEKDVVDGAVLDVIKGFQLNGQKIPSFLKDEPLVTYVLVVKKRFKEDPLYKEFLRLYREAVVELSKEDTLLRALKAYKNVELSDQEAKEWQRMNMRFVLPGEQVNLHQQTGSGM